MIVVDTSALIEVLFDAPLAEACMAVMESEQDAAISAGTLTEASIVAGRRGLGGAMATLVRKLGAEIVPVKEAAARRVSAAYDRWGKGVHPARLTFGDCFAYALAEERGCPLLFIGDDFSRTDIVPCL